MSPGKRPNQPLPKPDHISAPTKAINTPAIIRNFPSSFICPEHFRKNSSHAEEKKPAVLLGFGFVFAQSQAAAGMLLRSASPKRQNSSLPNGYGFSSNALAPIFVQIPLTWTLFRRIKTLIWLKRVS
jgi:hypothetical protein